MLRCHEEHPLKERGRRREKSGMSILFCVISYSSKKKLYLWFVTVGKLMGKQLFVIGKLIRNLKVEDGMEERGKRLSTCVRSHFLNFSAVIC